MLKPLLRIHVEYVMECCVVLLVSIFIDTQYTHTVFKNKTTCPISYLMNYSANGTSFAKKKKIISLKHIYGNIRTITVLSKYFHYITEFRC